MIGLSFGLICIFLHSFSFLITCYLFFYYFVIGCPKDFNMFSWCIISLLASPITLGPKNVRLFVIHILYVCLFLLCLFNSTYIKQTNFVSIIMFIHFNLIFTLSIILYSFWQFHVPIWILELFSFCLKNSLWYLFSCHFPGCEFCFGLFENTLV